MRDRSLFLTLGLGLAVAIALVWAAGSAGLAAAAPQAPTAGSDWDGLGVSVPTVISTTGKYRMWYQGRGLTFYGYGSKLGYATSQDGTTWQKYVNNPVLGPGDPGEWDEAYRGQVTVLKDSGMYKMWYSGGGFSAPWQTGYATSVDGLDWEIYAGNPVLAAGPPGSWDETEADGPTVLKDGTGYKMWYYGCNADYTVCSIGHATSPDGIAWTKYAGNPVLESTPGEWDESGLGWPRVIKKDGAYTLWYHSDGKLGRATSLNGIDWTKDAGNPVLSEGWDGGPVGVSAILYEGGLYKMWTSSGGPSTRGIGYLESVDGIAWTQPVTVSNPLVVKGEAGLIVHARHHSDQVRAYTLPNTVVTITVSHAGSVEATIIGLTGDGGNFYSWDHSEDWVPAPPDIQPGDTVETTATGGYSSTIDPVGEVQILARPDTDVVAGIIHAPGYTGTLSVLCWLYDSNQMVLDEDVPADGGSFQCDFSGIADIVGGTGGQAGYLEPDGDWVALEFTAPYMEVYYGVKNGAGGIYAPDHTFWITVTGAAGDVKATAAVSTTFDGGWWGHGFRPTWSGGECCNWSPAEPDIQPGDWVLYQSDDGYDNQVRVGTIFGAIDLDNDTATGPIRVPWLNQTLEVGCHPQTMWPPLYRFSSAEPDGSVPYFCDWQDTSDGKEAWDVVADSEVMVHYREPDGDKVYRMMLGGEGVPPVWNVYLPLVLKNLTP